MFNPITNLVPKEAALARYSICPLWRISKHPFVKTILSSLNLHRLNVFSASKRLTRQYVMCGVPRMLPSNCINCANRCCKVKVM